MARIASRLVTRGFRAVAFDMPAHGHSTGDRVTALSMAGAIGAVARKTGPAHAIIAHSLGATATALALRDGLDVERVVLLAPAAEPTYFARQLARTLGLSKARTEGMLDRIRLAIGGDWNRVTVDAFAPEMTARLLLVHDPNDPDVPWSHGDAIASAWPDSKLLPVVGLGHRNILRNSEVIEAAVAFVDGSRTGGTVGGRPYGGRAA